MQGAVCGGVGSLTEGGEGGGDPVGQREETADDGAGGPNTRLAMYGTQLNTHTHTQGAGRSAGVPGTFCERCPAAGWGSPKGKAATAGVILIDCFQDT